jgi:tetratricopeptide (TPR) repeat protein
MSPERHYFFLHCLPVELPGAPMSTPVSKTIVALCCTIFAALTLAACGGAQARKAKHLEKGERYLSAGNYEKARVEFRNALQIAPNDSDARYENGVADEKLGNPREAAQFYQGAIDVNADNIAARVGLSRLYLFSGAPQKALDIIQPSLVKQPDDPRLLTVRAAARAQLKDPAAALTDAERAVQLDPSSEDAVAVLAGIYKSLNQADKARTLLESAIKRAPATVDLRLALAQLYSSMGQEPQVEALLIDLVRLKPDEKSHRLRLAQYYVGLGHFDEAERVLREGVKALPEERDLKVGLVDFLAARRGREAAGKELDELIAANPKDYSLKFLLGQYYEQGKEEAKAEAVYEGVITQARLEAPGITARNRLAALRVQNNDETGAQKLLAEVLAKSPRDNDALIMRGNLALMHKDPKAAIADLRSVLRDQPNSIGVMRTLARAHLANGEPALAEEIMRRAVDAGPTDVSARLDLAQLLIQLGKPEQAKPVVDGLVKQEPTNVAALDAQFKVAAATKDMGLAKSAADAIVAAQPRAGLGYFYQGAVDETDRRLEDAVRLYSKALELQPDAAEPLEAIARALVTLNRTSEALKRLDDVVQRFPALPFAANIKGGLLLATQHPAEAAQAFQTAIIRDPKHWQYYRGLALAQVVGRESDAAIATLKDGIAKSDNSPALEGELASLYEQLGKPGDAMQIYENTLRRDPQSVWAANNMAMLLVTYHKDQPSLDRAKELAARLANSPNPALLDTYGWVLYKRGEAAAAVVVLQDVLAKSPDSPVALYHLGMAQAQAGRTDLARDSLARSLKSGKKFTGMDEAKSTLEKLAKFAPADAASPKS